MSSKLFQITAELNFENDKVTNIFFYNLLSGFYWKRMFFNFLETGQTIMLLAPTFWNSPNFKYLARNLCEKKL